MNIYTIRYSKTVSPERIRQRTEKGRDFYISAGFGFWETETPPYECRVRAASVREAVEKVEAANPPPENLFQPDVVKILNVRTYRGTYID